MAGSGYSQEQGGDGFCQAGLELAMSCQGVPRLVPVVPAMSPLTTRLSR